MALVGSERALANQVGGRLLRLRQLILGKCPGDRVDPDVGDADGSIPRRMGAPGDPSAP